MGDPRDRKSKSPHTTALMASFAVLLTGSAVSTYFVQVRGVGWSALLAGSLAPELVIVCGAIVALAVVVHLSVARALGVAQSAQTPRMMIRRALEVLDTAEFDTTELEDLPTEVRDLVAAFAAQKSREQQLERELQAMHRGTRELVQRLEQSGAKLEPLNADSKDELATRVARAWNPLVEQVRLSRDPARAMPDAPLFSPAALFAREDSDTGAQVEEASGDVARRLGELETNLSMLWNEMRGLQTFVPETAAAEPPKFSPASQPPPMSIPMHMSESRPMPVAPPMPLPLSEPPALVTLPETRTFEALQVVPTFAGIPEVVAEPEAIVLPWTAPEMPAFDSVESVPESPAEDIRWATSEVLQPDRSTKASESGYFAWTGQSTQEGSWKLRDEAPEELRRSDEAKAAAEAAPMFVDDTYPQLPPRLQAAPSGTAMPASPPMAPSGTPATPGVASPSFETHFPHFVGKPVQQLDGRVEVSFEGSTSESPETRRPKGSAKRSGPETPGATPKFDLHSLGALEIDE